MRFARIAFRPLANDVTPVADWQYLCALLRMQIQFLKYNPLDVSPSITNSSSNFALARNMVYNFLQRPDSIQTLRISALDDDEAIHQSCMID